MKTKQMSLSELRYLQKKSIPTTFVVDEGGVYNFFSVDDFDENGCYINDKSYHIKDYDIIAQFSGEHCIDDADRLIESLTNDILN